MSTLRECIVRFCGLFNKQRKDRELEEEIESHLQFHIEDNLRLGMTPEEARRQALIKLGGIESTKEAYRDQRGLLVMESLLRDIRYGARMLRKNLGFTAVAVLTLAVCIGANLAIFAVVDAILVRSLPFPNPERLVVIHNAYPGTGIKRGNASIANYFERRKAIRAFTSVSLHTEYPFTLGEGVSSRRIETARVTPEFFQTLGVRLAMGREFTDEELEYETGRVAIITDRFWRSYFNADTNVLGRTFRMHTFPITVIGVLPPGFRYLSSKAEVYRPHYHDRYRREPKSRHSNDGQMIARLAVNRTMADAQAELKVLNTQLLSDDPIGKTIKDTGYYTWVTSLHADHVASVKPVLLLLQAGVLCLLLIGGVNLAGLLLIRASGRMKEIAVRHALGASQWHIARTILAETILLSLGGGVIGVLLAFFGIRLAGLLGANTLPLWADMTFDVRLANISILASIAVGVGLAIPIIWLNLRDTTNICLQSETRGGTTSRSVQHLRHSFIVTQIAIAFLLLCGAGLLSVSLKRTLNQSPGFESGKVLTAEIILPWEHYPTNPKRVSFVHRLEDSLRTLPGVTHAAVSTGLPFTIDGSVAKTIFPEGFIPGSSSGLRAHYFSSVSPDYWKAMNIPLLQGRFIEDSDMADPPRVAVIDEALARQYWPEGNPIGRRFSATPYSLFERKLFGEVDAEFVEKSAYTIVGVVGNVKHNDLAETEQLGAVYVPYTDSVKFQMIIRTPVSASITASTVERLIRQLDPELPLNDFKTMQARIDDSLVTRRSPAILAVVFAGVATLLAAIGTYGVLAYAVSQRRREVGVRMALGATPDQIGRQFFSLGLRLLAFGALLGGIGAWAAGRAMQSILFEVPSFHIPTFAGTAVAMSLVTLLASLLPAIRAARISPTEAMRNE
jgi:predicted permease